MTKEQLTLEEELILKSLKEARNIQDYLWNRINGYYLNFCLPDWVEMFDKRVDKIKKINPEHPHAKVELKKIILQQAALSILALRAIDEMEGNVIK